VAERFGGGNPFKIFEDIFYGDDRHGTGWTHDHILLLGAYAEVKDQKTEMTSEGFMRAVKFLDRWEVKG
jgi:hypothetical protein